MKIIPAKKLSGTVKQVLKASNNDFVSAEVESLDLTYGGVKGDFHEGLTRKSGGREPWYDRGTEMRNERHLSILSQEELGEIAKGMGIETIQPGWIGANLIFSGIPNLSYLPPRTLLMFENGVTLRVDGYNAPCRLSGGSIAKNVGLAPKSPEFIDMALSFKDAAEMKRGLVAWVEREGTIQKGESFTARIWDQWIYE